MTTESQSGGTTQNTDTTQAAAAVTAPAVAAVADTTQQAPAAQAAVTPPVEGAEGELNTDVVKPGAPEKYEFKATEGLTFAPEVLGSFEGLAKELGLPQEAAQKVLDTMGPQIAAAQQAAIAKQQAEWTALSASDKEFGGEKLAENLAVAKKALDAVGSPELTQLLNDSGLGNHPEIIRAFLKVGKSISEGSFVSGGMSQKGAQDAASVLYPNSK